MLDDAASASHSIPWSLEELSTAPETFPAPGFTAEGVRALFYAGRPWQGRPTRVFAWVGLPDVPAGQKVPGMVLAHGGGGTAFAEWVRLWNDRGYAAIAMDNGGCTPGGSPPDGTGEDRTPHETGGPQGWGRFDEADLPPREQWSWHAVADVILAHSLLRSLPGVDADRIGLTGISWGGYLTCIASSIDHRFVFGAPVYGCGWLGEDSAWLSEYAAIGEEKRDRWLSLWDPSVYLPLGRRPMLWVNGTNDFAYPLGSYRKSYRLSPAPRTLSIKVRLEHGHPPGMNQPEVFAFADERLKGGTPLIAVNRERCDCRKLALDFTAHSRPVRAELNYTLDGGSWQERCWQTAPADLGAGTASADIPENSVVAYLSITDERGLIVSGEHVEPATEGPFEHQRPGSAV